MKEYIFDELCEVSKAITGIDVRYTRSRKREFVQIRCAIINVMRKYYSASTVQIARSLGLHHTTIIHHCRDHQSRYRYEDDYMGIYDKMVRHALNTSETISTDKMIDLMRSALSV